MMRITRKIRLVAAASKHVDKDTTPAPSIVQLGNIAELVKGPSTYNFDSYYGHRM